MSEPAVHSTFVLERSYPKPPAAVFAAFADPARKRRWYSEGDHHDVEAFAMDFRIGGTERYVHRFKAGTPIAGMVIVNDGVYFDIVPDERIVTSAGMTLDGRSVSAALVTFEFVATTAGTDLICTHQGVFFEGSDGPERREGGWRVLFDKLTAELER